LGCQALKQIKGRIPEVMNELGLTDRMLIQKYLVPLLEAKETKFFKEGKRRINVPALGFVTLRSTRHSNSAAATLHAIQRKQSSWDQGGRGRHSAASTQRD
jgi:hypothetical protein